MFRTFSMLKPCPNGQGFFFVAYFAFRDNVISIP